jgi:hypothetical protein
MIGSVVMFVDQKGEVRMWLGPEAADRWRRNNYTRHWRMHFAPIEDEM